MKKYIKVCGMRDAKNIESLAELDPDFMGFIFYPKSPRYVGQIDIPELPENIKKIGVFVKETIADVIEIAQKHDLSGVQLHSDETPENCAEIRKTGLLVIKAFAVDSAFNFEDLKPFEDHVDYFLFDTKGDGYGGHGTSFDWDILKGYTLNKPFFVAGGVSNDNIGKLQKLDHPMFRGVDVNSKYEISPGIKDIEALKQLFLTIRT
jgi:phosphoribosylanthranilate isomerase